MEDTTCDSNIDTLYIIIAVTFSFCSGCHAGSMAMKRFVEVVHSNCCYLLQWMSFREDGNAQINDL